LIGVFSVVFHGELTRESVALAFVAALQFLPPRQRAALILRDALDWDVSAIASLLRCSAASVNSALQRARGKFKTVLGNGDTETSAAISSKDVAPEILERYMQAWEAGDADALADLLREDAVLTMPPSPSWYRSRADILAFFSVVAFGEFRGMLHLVPLAANRQPAFAIYRWDSASLAYEAMAIKVLTLDGRLISRITGFIDSDLFRLFALPARVDRPLQSI
jgi:RNA polymerase sigma-70 factor (ECF subfamily)